MAMIIYLLLEFTNTHVPYIHLIYISTPNYYCLLPHYMILDPVAAYVIKTVDVATGEKVFINVCTDSQISKPSTLDASEIALQVTRGEDWIVPIVVSTGHHDKDKAGNPCFAVDCCMNPSVVLLGIEDPSVKVLIVETCIELVEDRFKRMLSRDYKFPRMKSKGILQKTEVDERTPHAQPDHNMDIELTQDESSEIPKQPPSVKVIASQESSPFYFHVYRGKYSGNGTKPSHVVEISGEHHDIKLREGVIEMDENKLNLQFSVQKVDAFYNEEDETTYVMLWKQV